MRGVIIMNNNVNRVYIKRIGNIICRICVLVSIATSIGLCGEIIIRSSIMDIYKYVCMNTKVFSVSVLLILGILIFTYCIFNNLGIATLITGSLTVIVYMINYYKYIFKGEYVGPADLLLLKEAVNISEYFQINITLQMVWALACIVWIAIITLILKERIISRKKRLVGAGVGILIIATSIGAALNNVVLANINTWNVNVNYENNGFLFTYINRINELKVDKPENYSQSTVESLVHNIVVHDKDSIQQKPNIIMIMNEAWYDPTELPDITFSEDPMPFFRNLQTEYAGGNIITAVFGGYTAQTEYEVLTGNSVDFTGKANVAYTRYVYDNMPSMVRILKNLGYKALAIHPYNKSFYSRSTVYEKLGFDEFLSKDDFESAEIKTAYISDKDVYKRIIQEYEEYNAQEEPMFVHVVTMQNHGPYSTEYNEHNITVDSSKLSNDTKKLVENYSNLLKESDNALKGLIEYFSQVDEPTIIMMFGDHPPVLGDDYAAYREVGIFDTYEGVNTNYMIHHTPYVIWNNYGQEFNSFTNIDASYLGSILLNEANINYDKYFTYLYNQIPLLKAYNEEFYINKDNQIKEVGELEEQEKQVLEDLWILQYDRIFENKYIDRIE